MESKPLVVVGAGVSGTAAAIEAARAGVQVTLIDENPIGMSMIGLDVPQFFGQRIDGALGNPIFEDFDLDVGQTAVMAVTTTRDQGAVIRTVSDGTPSWVDNSK